MNRPTKYRAWANGKMRDVRAISFTQSGEVHRILDAEGVQRVPEALLQFTGLRDKNGKDVFDGDIIACQSMRENCLHQVIWQGPRLFGGIGEWHLEGLAEGARYDWIGGEEIRGNIFENPELLA